MAYHANYSWEDTGRMSSFVAEPQGRAGLGWWVLLAILLSILVHIFLIIIFDIIKVEQWVPSLLRDNQMITFKTSRVTISKAALEEILPAPDLAKEIREDVTPLVDNTLDEFELQEMLADMEVKLTPEVTEATRILAADTPEVPQGATTPQISDTIVAAPEKIEMRNASLKSQLLKVTRASEHQPLLELNVEPSQADKEDIIQTAKAGVENGSSEADIAKDFSNLNQLLSKTGSLGDNTKPILMPTDLLFSYNEYELKEEAKLSLMRLGILIQRNPDSEFVIEGHTDTFGDDQYNKILSERRAYAVRDWLVNSLRIEADNIRALGYGKSRPLINPNGSIEEQSLNRRVEIVINKKKKPVNRA